MLAILLAAAAILAPNAEGHGFMSKPMTRAKCDNRENDGKFVPDGCNGGGPEYPGDFGATDEGGMPGVCGDPCMSPFGTPSHLAEEPCTVQETYKEGSEITVSVEIVANHGGFMEFSICDKETGLTEQCFDKNILITESGVKEYWILPPEPDNPGSAHAKRTWDVKVQLPPGLTCEKCTMMWTWWTAHVCGYACDPEICGGYAGFNNPVGGGSGQECPSLRPTKGNVPQIFRACGDIAIVPNGGGGVAKKKVPSTWRKRTQKKPNQLKKKKPAQRRRKQKPAQRRRKQNPAQHKKKMRQRAGKRKRLDGKRRNRRKRMQRRRRNKNY